jgi:hypothetical protein
MTNAAMQAHIMPFVLNCTWTFVIYVYAITSGFVKRHDVRNINGIILMFALD